VADTGDVEVPDDADKESDAITGGDINGEEVGASEEVNEADGTVSLSISSQPSSESAPVGGGLVEFKEDGGVSLSSQSSSPPSSAGMKAELLFATVDGTGPCETLGD